MKHTPANNSIANAQTVRFEHAWKTRRPEAARAFGAGVMT